MDTVHGVLDIGANTGQSAIEFHRLFPRARIVSVEPVADVYRQLEAACRRWPRVECVHAAIGEEERRVEISVAAITQLSSLVCRDTDGAVESVGMTTLAALVARLQMSRVDFLKIDVEGYERQVLAGGRPLLEHGAIPLILVEAGVNASDPRFTPLEVVRDALVPFGYEIYGIYDQGYWGRDGRLLYVNVLLTSRRLRGALDGRSPHEKVNLARI